LSTQPRYLFGYNLQYSSLGKIHPSNHKVAN